MLTGSNCNVVQILRILKREAVFKRWMYKLNKNLSELMITGYEENALTSTKNMFPL